MLQYYFVHLKSSWTEAEVPRWEASPEPPDENMQNLLLHFLFFCFSMSLKRGFHTKRRVLIESVQETAIEENRAEVIEGWRNCIKKGFIIRNCY
jgi:hypothetical protein